jgi:hypothetical protein
MIVTFDFEFYKTVDFACGSWIAQSLNGTSDPRPGPESQFVSFCTCP